MTEIYLTAYDGAFLGPIAKLLGWVMDKIYVFLVTDENEVEVLKKLHKFL